MWGVVDRTTRIPIFFSLGVTTGICGLAWAMACVGTKGAK